eukprot:403377236
MINLFNLLQLELVFLSIQELLTNKNTTLKNENIPQHFNEQNKAISNTYDNQDNSLTHYQDSLEQPLIGILTLPKEEALFKGRFNHDQYILGVNQEFVEQGGSRGLELIDPDTMEQHQYYKKGKKILEYSISYKDSTGQDFPVFGVCQGYQLIILFAAKDQNVLETIQSIDENRSKNWKVANPKKDSKIFSNFEDDLIQGLKEYELAYNNHLFSISLDKFNNNTNLTYFYQVIQTDYKDNLEYVCVIEGKYYPFYGVLYHLEYQIYNREQGFKTNKNKKTLRIVKHISEFMFTQVSQNNNRPVRREAWEGQRKPQ